MTPKYAKDQPAGFTNRIERFAVIGTDGQIGKYITEELLKTGKHAVTALTKPETKSKFPDEMKVIRVEYDDKSSLVSALRGQQFLVIILSVNAPKGLHSNIVQSAAKAGVPETLVGFGPRAYCNEIEAAGVSSWIALVCNLWYEYSLAMGPEWFGFDFKSKKLTLYDDGSTKINVSTWDQCARLIAALASLKELPEDEEDKSPTINQQEMFESWKRVTRDKDEEWAIKCEPVDERYNRGLSLMTKGDRRGFALAMFVRFLTRMAMEITSVSMALQITLLQLPAEDLDERTKVAKDMLDNEYSLWVMNRV